MKRLVILCLFIISVSVSAQDTQEGRYTFVFLNTNEERAELPQAQDDSLQAGHMANIKRLVKDRKMIAAGPFYDGGGIFIFDTGLPETQAVLNTDPAIAAGRYKLEVLPFNMEMGKICAPWDVPEEDVTMTSYYIARYSNKFESFGTGTSKYTARHMRDAQRKFAGLHVHGTLKFDGNQGQVVIFEAPESEAYEAYFAKHKLVQKGQMDVYVRRIYFPKGIFCEK